MKLLIAENNALREEVRISKENERTQENVVSKMLGYQIMHKKDIEGKKLMNEDFGVFTSQQLFEKNKVLEARWQSKFTNPSHEPLHLAHSYLANKFALTFNEP